MRAQETNGIKDEIVMVPVPSDLLFTVYAAITDATRSMKEIPIVSSPSIPLPTSSENGRKEWTEQEIRELKEIPLSPTVQVLLDLTAKQAGNWIDYAQIRQKAGREPREAQGELSGFSQLLRRRFGRQGQDEWPVQVKNAPQGQTRYYMSRTIARWWKSDWIQDSESLENEIGFLFEKCTSEAVESKAVPQIVVKFIDRILDLSDLDADTAFKILGKIMHHVNKRAWEIERDMSCLSTPMQLMFDPSFFKRDYEDDEHEEEEDVQEQRK